MDRRRSIGIGPAVASAAYELVQDALLPPAERIKLVLDSLPVLGKESVDLEEPCPICLMPFETVFVEDVSEGGDQELGGVTKLVGCGHVFCRKDLTEWIRSQHGSCPTCRHTFLNIRPPSESDDESSDGGEYIPDDFEDEDEDGFLDVDAFTDADADDFPVEPMDIDFDELWEDELEPEPLERDPDLLVDADMYEEEEYEETETDRASEWGLTDGESESMSSSEGDTTMEDELEEASVAGALEREFSVSVHEDEALEGLDANDLVGQDPK